MTPFERRLVDVEAARLLRVLVLKTSSKKAPGAWQRWADLAEIIHRKVCTESCSWADVLTQIEATQQRLDQSGYTKLAELPDEHTPAERPLSKRWWQPW